MRLHFGELNKADSQPVATCEWLPGTSAMTHWVSRGRWEKTSSAPDVSDVAPHTPRVDFLHCQLEDENFSNQ